MSAFRGRPCAVRGWIGLRIMAICRCIWPRLARAMGDSQRSGAPKFPRGGQSKKIVDAVRGLLEAKEINARKNGDKRTILGEVDGVKIRVVYRIRDNEP